MIEFRVVEEDGGWNVESYEPFLGPFWRFLYRFGEEWEAREAVALLVAFHGSAEKPD